MDCLIDFRVCHVRINLGSHRICLEFRESKERIAVFTKIHCIGLDDFHIKIAITCRHNHGIGCSVLGIFCRSGESCLRILTFAKIFPIYSIVTCIELYVNGTIHGFPNRTACTPVQSDVVRKDFAFTGIDAQSMIVVQIGTFYGRIIVSTDTVCLRIVIKKSVKVCAFSRLIGDVKLRSTGNDRSVHINSIYGVYINACGCFSNKAAKSIGAKLLRIENIKRSDFFIRIFVQIKVRTVSVLHPAKVCSSCVAHVVGFGCSVDDIEFFSFIASNYHFCVLRFGKTDTCAGLIEVGGIDILSRFTALD